MGEPIDFIRIEDRLAAKSDVEIKRRRKYKEANLWNGERFEEDRLDARTLENMVLADPNLAALFITDLEQGTLTERIEEFVDDWIYPSLQGKRGTLDVINKDADYSVVFQDPRFIDAVVGFQSTRNVYTFNSQWLAEGNEYETFADMVADEEYRSERSAFTRMVEAGELLRAEATADYPGGLDAFTKARNQARVDIAVFLNKESVASDSYWAVSSPEFKVELEEISNDLSLDDSKGIDEDTWQMIRNTQPVEAAQWFIENKEAMETEFAANTNYRAGDAQAWFFTEKAEEVAKYVERYTPLSSVRQDAVLRPFISEAIRDFDSTTALAMANNIYSELVGMAIRFDHIKDRTLLWAMLESGENGSSLHGVLNKTLRDAVATGQGGDEWLETLDATGLDLVDLWEVSGRQAGSQKAMLDSVISAGVEAGVPPIILDPDVVNSRTFVIDMLNGKYDDLDQYSREQIIGAIEGGIANLTNSKGQLFQSLSQNNLAEFSRSFARNILVTDVVDAVLKNNILAAGGEDLLKQMEQGLGLSPEAFVNKYRGLGIDPKTRYVTQWQSTVNTMSKEVDGSNPLLANSLASKADNFSTASYQSIEAHANTLLDQLALRYPDYSREDIIDGTLDEELIIAGEEPSSYSTRIDMFVNQEFQALIGDDDLAAGIINFYGSANDFFAANPQLQEADSAEIQGALEGIPELSAVLQEQKKEANALRSILRGINEGLSLTQQASLNEQAQALVASLTGGDAPLFDSEADVFGSTEFSLELEGFRENLLNAEARFTGAEQAVAQYVQGLNLNPADVPSALRSAQSAFSELEATGKTLEEILASPEFQSSVTGVTEAGDARRLQQEDQRFARNAQETLDPAFRSYVERLMGSNVSNELINDLLPELLQKFRASGESELTGGFVGYNRRAEVDGATGETTYVRSDEETRGELDARSLNLQKSELGARFQSFAGTQGFGLQKLLGRQRELRVGKIRTATPTGGRQIRNPSVGVGL